MQKRFHPSPSSFIVCKPELLRVKPLKEFTDIDLIMPFSFVDLANWPRSHDFNQFVDKDSIYGFPDNLTDLANFLEKGQSRPMSGAKTGLNVKEGARALKIKIIKDNKKIPSNLQSQNMKLDCITSGSRMFENCAK